MSCGTLGVGWTEGALGPARGAAPERRCAVKVPVITGTGQLVDLDTDDYIDLVLLPEACSAISPELWDLFAEGVGPESRRDR